jgi:signal transduction histidine kinase
MTSSSFSIGRKLGWLSILSSGSAILAVSLALLFFELQEVRGGLLRRLESVADLIAFNSAAAVDFNDADAAAAILGSLKTRPEVVSAGIVVKGRIFAIYGGPDAAEGGGATNRVRLPDGDDLLRPTAGHRFTDQDLTVFRPISHGGRALGTLFIRSNLREIGETWRGFAAVTGAVAIPALLIAILISQLPRRAFSRPILNLASLAVAVSNHKDYSVRAPAMRSAAEIEQLVTTFNQMLTDLQRQHLEIQEAQATLEQRVADRTRELQLRGAQLEAQGRQLAAANEELESFSYSVSHDLRAPLRAIDGFSEALLNRYDNRVLDGQGMHYLQRVRDGTRKMARLIDDLLDLARVSRSTLKRHDVDVTAIAEEVEAELEKRHPDRRVACRIEQGMRASADPHLLTIVFENLLGNAWKYTGKVEDAHIEVGQTADGGQPHFFVRDNGAGFDMTYADKLFGVFQRLHADSDFEGTGVGLATVKRIVGRHGGLVWADARVGVGATFCFTLGGQA